MSYIIFSRVRHEQERSRNYSMLSIPTQLRIVPENSVISMGTYYGRRGCFLVFVLSQERYWGFPGGQGGRAGGQWDSGFTCLSSVCGGWISLF